MENFKSIWGPEEKETVDLLNRLEIKGMWLNLACGDGRFNQILLENADKVIDSDIDSKVTKELKERTPKKLEKKLEIVDFDMTNKFPFKDIEFDGIFCTGQLHSYSKNQLKKIFKEINRVLKKEGLFVFDFATDIKRVLSNNSLHIWPGETSHSAQEAKEILAELLHNYEYQLVESSVPEEPVNTGQYRYIFSCKFLLVSGKKLL